MRPPSPGSPQQRPRRAVVVLLLLAGLTVITLDARGGDDSPVDPLRSAVGAVVGPVETGTSAVLRPVIGVPGFFRTTGGLRDEVARLEAENAQLRGRLATSEVDRNRAAELDGLLAGAKDTGYAVVPARVVAMGPAQSFSRAVTIDAGTSSGISPDMTVINNDGLVGRVIRAERSTATVLLVVDQESVVGGRIGSTMEVGFLRGRGEQGDDARLDLDLADQSVTPARRDVLVTWGSRNGAPYVAGIPIGRVTDVRSSPGSLSAQAVIKPFVDFTSLDLVGVVVDPNTEGDRPVLGAGARQEETR
ncbi:rod shape-determining protein MreC [Nocardioides iriomotensis]|uniref:Cell shape-determining protein MreC n=1 Tax=Nocardioides iriomotensis TaxID=715784 RepID=A0A4Q5J5F0_9ACTN|nr:rod shape-determining protein MreC [Nocardioides iriomotensis]RYU13088.1 rod shape-determining protein MreC [Nocardioides iriomotensis]